MSGREQSNPAGRSLVKRCQESEPALISIIFSFLLCLSEVKYHQSKSRKGEKTVNLLCLMRSNSIYCSNLPHNKKTSRPHLEAEEESSARITDVSAKF